MHDRCIRACHQRAPSGMGRIAHDLARHHWRLIRVRGEREFGVHPITIASQIVHRVGVRVLELGGPQLCGQSIFAALDTILKQALLAHPDERRNR